MIRHTLKILQHLLQDFLSLPDHFGTLRIKGLKKLNSRETIDFLPTISSDVCNVMFINEQKRSHENEAEYRRKLFK